MSMPLFASLLSQKLTEQGASQRDIRYVQLIIVDLLMAGSSDVTISTAMLKTVEVTSRAITVCLTLRGKLDLKAMCQRIEQESARLDKFVFDSSGSILTLGLTSESSVPSSRKEELTRMTRYVPSRSYDDDEDRRSATLISYPSSSAAPPSPSKKAPKVSRVPTMSSALRSSTKKRPRKRE